MSGTSTGTAFIGIGNMGRPMAANLVARGFDVAVADAAPGRASQFVAEVGGTTYDPTSHYDTIITMLPTSTEVRAALAPLISDSLLEGVLVIDMTSGAPAATQAIADEVRALGGAMIDAPVSGGVPRARTGDLAIMVGGDDRDIERARPWLEALGSDILTCGGLGAGQAMKALNNLVSAGGFLISVEALLIGQRFGLDPARMVEVLNASTGMNNSTQKKMAQYVLSRSFDSGFGLDLMVKDLRIALGIGTDTHTATPFAGLLVELAGAAQAMLGPGQDHTALARIAETLAGAELHPAEP